MIRKFNGINIRTPGVGSTSISTTSATDTLLNSVAIDANTFVTGDCIRIRAAYTRLTTLSTTYSLRLHYNTTNSLAGATQLALLNALSGDPSSTIYRTMTFKPSNQAIIFSTGTSATEDTGVSTASSTTLSNISLSSTMYIIASAQKTSAAARSDDTMRNIYLTIEV